MASSWGCPNRAGSATCHLEFRYRRHPPDQPELSWPAKPHDEMYRMRRKSLMDTLDTLDAESLRSDVPDFRPGDTLKVHVRVIEGSRSRVQVFQGVVIR